MIGEKLKEIRESVGMNKKEFAQYLGLKYTTYNNYETEAREPASDFLILISEKFDVSIDYILGLKTNSNILHSYQLKAGEYDHIKKYRALDLHGKEMVDFTLEKEWERSTADTKEKVETGNVISIIKEPEPDYLAVNAAREDKSSTLEERQAGDAIMTDDSEWE